MDKRNLLLRIKLCPGIGIKGEAMLAHWIKHASIESDLGVSILNQLTVILKKHHLKYERFERCFLSDEVNKRVDLNQKQHWITILDAEYPQQLADIYCPPIVLFFVGDVTILKTRSISIVGARQCTNYSIAAIKSILTKRVLKRFTIVSGLAKGVDCLSHQCALANNERTIGVIGTGLDGSYPSECMNVQNELMNTNLVVSEYPLGSKPLKYHFVERNRIIAGLCEKLIVVEAKQKSGSLITASLALSENRDVLAVPGNITSPLSIGCNQLIASGARPCLSDNDVLEESLV
ncbi:DNA-processing protein DprA [Fructilactobacillus fructivorans]|uniref:DNA-protecting protein DprA n=1 Tax=Fructilactobacillus fructivorans TaxID=1614 RepID=A0AAE6P181_9LACO|nr:DNA-processing protein DprA [Fructilactobacillus fructivorans]KRK58660.1 DNA protecting protein DprA [Fructilactobacillus fructivorans]QFX92663.1 DNA-protecting protein DprA [Fructilactobacillus fructivorans]RDV65744.1 DNA-protecting protein DprA [Fructilactobacillus fructivorans]